MPVSSPPLCGIPHRPASLSGRSPRHAVPPTALLLSLVLTLLAGCARQTVGHLARAQMQTDTPQTISLQYLRVTYQVVPQPDSVSVRGHASPVPGALPDWARWYEQLAVMIYISDAAGRVLTTVEYDYPPGAVHSDDAFPFERLFPLDAVGSGPLYVSFGYRMVTSEHEPVPDTGCSGRSLVVGEGALDN